MHRLTPDKIKNSQALGASFYLAASLIPVPADAYIKPAPIVESAVDEEGLSSVLREVEFTQEELRKAITGKIPKTRDLESTLDSIKEHHRRIAYEKEAKIKEEGVIYNIYNTEEGLMLRTLDSSMNVLSDKIFEPDKIKKYNGRIHYARIEDELPPVIQSYILEALTVHLGRDRIQGYVSHNIFEDERLKNLEKETMEGRQHDELKRYGIHITLYQHTAGKHITAIESSKNGVILNVKKVDIKGKELGELLNKKPLSIHYIEDPGLTAGPIGEIKRSRVLEALKKSQIDPDRVEGLEEYTMHSMVEGLKNALETGDKKTRVADMMKEHAKAKRKKAKKPKYPEQLTDAEILKRYSGVKPEFLGLEEKPKDKELAKIIKEHLKRGRRFRA